jgi:apolipoprotein N-acyltransferase
VKRIARTSVALACLGAPFLWVTFEFARAHLPEISFPWNLLGYSAAQNLALAQVTTVTGIYGLSFVMAGLTRYWRGPMRTRPPVWRSGRAGLVFGSALMIAAFAGQRMVPRATANHFARQCSQTFRRLIRIRRIGFRSTQATWTS